MTAPPNFLPAPMQKTTVVKVVGVAPKPAVTQTLVSAQETQAPVSETKKEPAATFTPETLESVKKCKNFLVTLIKLASSDPRSANMANNVRGLVRSLLEGKLEAEEFTEQLYQELKSTPQPCLVPFLKKSLPAVRRLTADPQLFIQQASTSTWSSSSQATSNETVPDPKRPVVQPAAKVVLKPGVTSIINSRNSVKPTVIQPKHLTGVFSVKQSFTRDVTCSSRSAVKSSSGSYKEDDDINDVAFMAGVNLREENAQFLTTTVGSVLQSCQDQPFLSTNTVLSRILRTGRPLGVTDISAEVVTLVSHATQEYLRGLLEKVTVIAEHRKTVTKEDQSYSKVSDVRSQLRFLEEVEALNKKKSDEAEREKLLRLARSRSHPEDPQFQLLKQKAKELQQIEEAQLQQREANITALAAIGPRRKRPVEQSEGQVCVLPRQDVSRVTRVVLRDLLVCMEQENFLRHSLTLYKAML
ncbi:transcription initiation factor TFIID subunit 4-like [Cynoglossus semilaevis]|uniref:transcription initiation factor TFIID subunit 4-like n=1 Tax=Cynoglossus semilaevis TaxID=244447 RepID=UPI000D62C394|nr:transcription initiation factor TFIID subunit 4-like [Cynoglossus semilaevis]